MIEKEGLIYINEYLLIALGGYFLFLIPTLIIYVSYLLANNNDKMIIDFKNETIKYYHKNDGLFFDFDDIKKIDIYINPSKLRGATGWVPWDIYHYMALTLNNGKKILVTSLLADEFKIPVQEDKIHYHKVFYPYLREYTAYINAS
jgi:hypothetical protein